MKRRMDKVERAMKLLEEERVKLVVETANAYYFEVTSLYDKNLKHDVIIKKYKTEGKPDAYCTCKWFIYRSKECSHIKACKMLIEFRKNGNDYL